MSRTASPLRVGERSARETPIEMVSRWAKMGCDELNSAKMGTRWLQMDKIKDKRRQDGAQMRKMEDFSSVLGPPGGYEHQEASNSAASRGAGEG